MPLLSRREFLKLLGAASMLPLGLDAVPARADLPTIFQINNRPISVQAAKPISLLDFLRSDLRLTGTKYSCGAGVCGACTVLINGRPIKACQVNLRDMAGLEVTTIEGLGGSGSLDPIQKTFADLCVFQCGYCAPGMVMTTRALFNENPNPTLEQIREALAGNLCRCTGYWPIIEAVKAAADPAYLEFLLKRPYSGLGTEARDRSAEDKAAGRFSFAADYSMPGMLYAQVVWSAYPHAGVLVIDVSAAESLPGVMKVLTYQDVPGTNAFGSVYQDQPILVKDRVRFLGDAVAVSVGRTPEAARAGAEAVVVEYEPLPGVFSPQEALEPEAPQLTDKGNVCFEVKYAKGDIDQGRAKAAVVYQQTYETPFIEHAYLETESCLTFIDREGRLTVVSASQAPQSFRDQIASACGIKPERVIMETTPAGGAFGAKGELSVQHLCALATAVTGRPVSLSLTREESIRVHVKRHPFTLACETGLDPEGRLTHAVIHGVADAGAYNSATMPVMDNAAVFATGPYEIENIDVRITAAFTNNPTCGAMRGFGVPQVCLAMERQVDELAIRLGLDPLQVRLKNALEEGKVSQWGRVLGKGVGIIPCLKVLEEATAGAREEAELGPDEAVGLGFAATYKNTSTPTHLPFGKAEVLFTLSHEGRFVIYAAGCELGQGLETSLAQIGASALGLPVDLIEIVAGDTVHIDSPVMTTGSQQVFLTGGAILDGGPAFVDLAVQAAARLWGESPDKLALGPSGVADRESGRVLTAYHRLAWRSELEDEPLTMLHKYHPPVETVNPPVRVTETGPDKYILPSLGYGAQAALVAVNRQTGQVRLLKLFAAQDVGHVINRAGVEGQIRGAAAMGIGWCLKERLVVREGRIMNDNFHTYNIPRSVDVPPIEVLIVEAPDPFGPHGAKGVGEVPLAATAPAVLNAIRDATGLEITSIPVTEEILKEMLGRG